MELAKQEVMAPKGNGKKKWSKPKLFSGKGIGFLGLGHVQSSTGPYGTPS